MGIKIANRLRPFSHRPGTSCIILGTNWSLKSYPKKLIFQNIEFGDRCEVDLDIHGLVENFTCQLDLEKGCIYIFGSDVRGYFRIKILGNFEGIDLVLDRGLKEEIVFTIDKKTTKRLYPKDRLALPIKKEKFASFSKDVERLCLGVHKKQNWDEIIQRKDMREIFPFWIKLGLQIPGKSQEISSSLFEKLFRANSSNISKAFKELFYARFSGMMCPVREDENYLNLAEPLSLSYSPLEELLKSAEYIRTLFFRQKENYMYILPLLPKEFVFGKFMNVTCDEVGFLDIQWSKKKIWKMYLRATATTRIYFVWQKFVRRFRVRTKKSDKGKIYEKGEPISINCGGTYIFDRFQK